MQYDCCPYKRRDIQSKAEIGMTQLQANTGQGLLGVMRTLLGTGFKTAVPRNRPWDGPCRITRSSLGPHYARVAMFSLAVAGNGDLLRVSNKGPMTESDLCFRAISQAAVIRRWTGGSVGRQRELGRVVLTGQVRDDEIVLSGMDRKGMIQMHGLLDIGGGLL